MVVVQVTLTRGDFAKTRREETFELALYGDSVVCSLVGCPLKQIDCATSSSVVLQRLTLSRRFRHRSWASWTVSSLKVSPSAAFR